MTAAKGTTAKRGDDRSVLPCAGQREAYAASDRQG
jgi:hypothetical protein